MCDLLCLAQAQELAHKFRRESAMAISFKSGYADGGTKAGSNAITMACNQCKTGVYLLRPFAWPAGCMLTSI